MDNFKDVFKHDTKDNIKYSIKSNQRFMCRIFSGVHLLAAFDDKIYVPSLKPSLTMETYSSSLSPGWALAQSQLVHIVSDSPPTRVVNLSFWMWRVELVTSGCFLRWGEGGLSTPLLHSTLTRWGGEMGYNNSLLGLKLCDSDIQMTTIIAGV